jgi:hypothetical protein
MGAQASANPDKGGVFCCGSGSDGCCKKNAGTTGFDIKRAQPENYPMTPDASADKQGSPWPQGNGLSPEKYVGTGGETEEKETYEDGSSYEGQLCDGKRHGRGFWKSETEEYTGQWKNDHRDGHGKQTWQDGRTYDGQFKEGKFHGRGKMEWYTQTGLMVYEGEYVDDLKHGNGRYVWPDNRCYDGQWKRGQRWGRAVYTNSNNQKRVGIWKEDKVERWLETGDEQGQT